MDAVLAESMGRPARMALRVIVCVLACMPLCTSSVRSEPRVLNAAGAHAAGAHAGTSANSDVDVGSMPYGSGPFGPTNSFGDIVRMMGGSSPTETTTVRRIRSESASGPRSRPLSDSLDPEDVRPVRFRFGQYPLLRRVWPVCALRPEQCV